MFAVAACSRRSGSISVTIFASALVDVSRNSIFQTYQTVLIGALTRELFERHDILVHFQPGARDILHVMPPFVVQESPDRQVRQCAG